MRASVETRERQIDCAESLTQRARKVANTLGTGSWAVICAVIALVLGAPTLAAYDTHEIDQEDRPSDAQLAANFFSHEQKFDELVQMLAADHSSLAAQGATAVNLTAMAGLETNRVRFGMYRRLLQQITVSDLRYFPDSGKLILVPSGQENLERPSKFYLYLPHGQSRSLVQHLGYDWHWPGVYVLSGDRPLKGLWFIHHDMTIGVAVSPY